MRLRRTAFGVVTAALLASAAPVSAAPLTSFADNAARASHQRSCAAQPLRRLYDTYQHPAGGVESGEFGNPELPDNAPEVLTHGEPSFPDPRGWPPYSEFGPLYAPYSRTSGTGRLAGGGFFWTDWLYDDHGTTTASTGGISVTAGSPSFGTYTYPAGAAHGNGADIFRAAVLDRAKATYWRVDWNTLASPTVPIAEWTFDRDDNTATGTSNWPGGAGVHSPGIDTALTMSCHAARLISTVSGKVLATFPVSVDMTTQSFITRIPTSVLDPAGTWRVRLAAGLADPTGTEFARPPDALPSQPAVYNVTFRRIDQEPVSDDYWDDMAQTAALRTGNVSAFSYLLDWSQLAKRVETPQPHPRGWSDRWYISQVDLGPGIITDPSSISDGKPNYLGRIQPYAVYRPKGPTPKGGWPVTFLLHSLTQNQNQYAATTPRFSKLACEDRRSICVTTLGRGPDGNYWDYAELDFWQVWHSVAYGYAINGRRVILCGYSMGGIGSNQLAMEHPDLFAKVIALAGAVGSVPTLANLHNVPVYLAGGVADELVPLTVEQAEANGLDALNDRYRWVVYPEVDHVAFELADSFADAATYMGNPKVVRSPRQFSYTWLPYNSQQAFSSRASSGGGVSWTYMPNLGIGAPSVYWFYDLGARSDTKLAKIVAVSDMRPNPSVTAHTSRGIAVQGPGPGVATELTWRNGSRPASRPVITLNLTNVGSLDLESPDEAGFRYGETITLRVTTDGRTFLWGPDANFSLKKGTTTVRYTF